MAEIRNYITRHVDLVRVSYTDRYKAKNFMRVLLGKCRSKLKRQIMIEWLVTDKPNVQMAKKYGVSKSFITTAVSDPFYEIAKERLNHRYPDANDN